MARVSCSRFLSAVLSFVFLFLIVLLATDRPALAQDAPVRPSRDTTVRPVVELPPLTAESLSVPAAAAVPAQPRAADMPELPWSRVVYHDRNSDKWDIYISADDGSDFKQLTNSRAVEVTPDLSRGGGTIVYASDEGGDFELWAMSASGSGAHPITGNGADEGQPRWSPDNSRIAFVSDRDGNPEIYTMKPNGTDVKRLTNSPDYDGDPTWSPDGRQIAFSSRRTGGYRIYVMNADGSNQTKLSDQPYGVTPAWSPNGRQIAYTAEGDTDGWLDLMLMEADGRDQHRIHNASGPADAFARSWSPDGTWIAFTQYNYVSYQGQWYIGSTQLMRFMPGDYNAHSFSNGVQYPFDPAWQSLDAIAPTSTITQLPARSPADVVVSWSGNDEGGSGLRLFDVQMQIDGGDWTNWQVGTGELGAIYTGTRGQRLAFRVRARDYATNFEPWPAQPQTTTTIETLPPVSAVRPLEAFIPAGEPFPVSWPGGDPGGSGIAGYDVQYRTADGPWVDWFTNTPEESADFDPAAHSLQPGQKVLFRSRAVDRATNQESWPATPDTSTTTYTWKVAGHIADNTGVPVGGATVTTNPAPILPVASGVDGDYDAYGQDKSSTAALGWTKPGYGVLPLTSFSTSGTEPANVVLPPADDVIVHGGFENAWPDAAWAASGTLPLARTTAVAGSGAYGLQFGEESEPFGAPEMVTPERVAMPDTHRLFLVDESPPLAATPVALWNTYDDGLFESSRAPDGTWSEPVSPLPKWIFSYVSAQDEKGRIHVVAYVSVNHGAGVDQMYIRRGVDGTWTEPEVLPYTPNGHPVSLTAGPGDAVQLVGLDEFGSVLFYQQRGPSGWTDSKSIAGTDRLVNDATHSVAADGTVTVVWTSRSFDGEINDVRARDRLPNGTWSDEMILYNKVFQGWMKLGKMLRDASGRLHLDWVQENHATVPYTADILYVQRTAAGWGRPKVIRHGQFGVSLEDMVLSAGGEPHVAFAANYAEDDHFVPYTALLSRKSDGSWQSPQILDDQFGSRINMAVDDADRTYIVWSRLADGDWQIGYRWREPDGQLTPITSMGGDESEWGPRIIVDTSGNRHILYNVRYYIQSSGTDMSDVVYARSVDATKSAEAAITQSVTVPAAMVHPVLSFRYSYSGATTSQTGFRAIIDGEPHSLPVAGDLAHTWFDLSAFAGQTIPITFRLQQGTGDPIGWAALDDVSLGSAHADVWVAASGATGLPGVNALPGETAELTFTIGNRGAFAATDAGLIITLPPELAFVSAAPAPSGMLPLYWNIGDLAAGDDMAIVLTVQVKSTAKPLTQVVVYATMSADDELETLNNSAEAWVALERSVYMPGVVGP